MTAQFGCERRNHHIVPGADCDFVVTAGAAVALHGLIGLHPANLDIPERSVPHHRLLP